MVCPNLLKRCLQTKGLQDLAIELVGENKADEFALWAFGERYSEINGTDKFADAWNERHSDIFTINQANPIVHDMIKMTKLWKLHEPAI
jgi:hypothetical protein